MILHSTTPELKTFEGQVHALSLGAAPLDATTYKDFRRMLDNEKGIDAVVVSTPDHTHAVIAADPVHHRR